MNTVEVIVQEFKAMNEWEDRYKRIIQIGKEAPSFSEDQKIKDNIVSGCQSQVWLIADLTDEKKIVFKADSDALIAKGLVNLMIQAFSNKTPDEVLSTTTDFISEIGLDTHLSANRSQGLAAMVKQMKYYATAYKALISQNF